MLRKDKEAYRSRGHGRLSNRHAYDHYDIQPIWNPHKDCLCDLIKGPNSKRGESLQSARDSGTATCIVHENGETSHHLPHCERYPLTYPKFYDSATIASDILRAEGVDDIVVPLNARLEGWVRETGGFRAISQRRVFLMGL